PTPTISSCFWNPFVTPSTMFDTSVRVSPCSALCSAWSSGRLTTTVPLSSATPNAGCRRRSSSPRGPFTLIRCPSIVAVTFFGSTTGFLPIRDMFRGSLPHDREQLAARVRRPGLPIRHQPLGGAEDRHAEPVPHARNLAHADVLAETRRGHTPHLADHRLIALRVAQVQPQNLAPLLGLERFHISNVVVLEKDACEIGLQF